jgi:pimeloyl-ACP methyl ester carboxylesterase
MPCNAHGMAGTPETRYAKDGDSHHIAYQVVGEGPDLLFVPTATFPIDLLWDEPTVAGHLRRLASFSRLILTDLLGTGSSDAVPIHDRPAMQAWIDGLVAVLDAVGSECVSVFAMSESALPAMLLTASHPQRVRSLVLFGPFASYQRTSDQPFGMPEPVLTKYLDGFERTVGTGRVVDKLAPSWAGDGAKRRWWARNERLSGGPGYFRAILDLYLHSDVSPALESIQVPTLLLHRRGDGHVRAEHASDLAERIPHARLVELEGDDNIWFAGDADRVLDEIESFLTGRRPATASPRTRCSRRLTSGPWPGCGRCRCVIRASSSTSTSVGWRGCFACSGSTCGGPVTQMTRPWPMSAWASSGSC